MPDPYVHTWELLCLTICGVAVTRMIAGELLDRLTATLARRGGR
jgi:hypothetical protein